MWTHAFPLATLPVGGVKLFRQGREQIAVFRVDDGSLYAVDNRCPHEGYPLIQGTVVGCTLTCCFHNFKFDLRDGACIKGDEAVRTWPIRVVDEQVELDLSPPDRRAALPRLWASLSEGLYEQRVSQATRDAARLLDAGVPPVEIAAFVAAWNGARAEYGATHVLPVANDVLAWAARYPGPRFAIPLAQLLDLAARDGVRRPERALAPPVDPGEDPVAAGHALRAAVEAEDAATAEALLGGALQKGWRRAEIEPWFFALCADHFLSFGHRLIYQIKTFDLLDAAGWAHAAPILQSHLFGIVNGTREDVLPVWMGFRRRLAALDLPAIYARAGADPSWRGHDALIAALLDAAPGDAFDALTAAIEAGAPLLALVDAISLSAAERMLRFDVAIDSDPSNQDNWLSVTHTQTYANALRAAVTRFPHPDVLKLLYYGARFVNHHRVLDLPPERRSPPPAVPTDLRALRDTLMDTAISDQFAVPIVAAHAIKNLIVAFEEHAATQDLRPLQALLRLYASPIQQRWTHRSAQEAVAFVTEGTVPTVLAP